MKEKVRYSKASLQKKGWTWVVKDIRAWMLMLPTIIMFYLLVWRPTVMGGVWSFFKMKGYTPVEFIGFRNFFEVIKDTQFWPTLGNTVQYVLWSLVIGYIPPFIIAVAFGDLNTKIESDAMQSLINGGLSLLIEKAEKADRVSSHHGDPKKVGDDKYVGRRTDNDYTYSIDHILSYGFDGKVKEYRIVEEQSLLNVTDHSPVFAEIDF